MSGKTILIMAGGTGGHIFPALAVAEILRSEGWRVLWIGNPDSMEARLIPRHGFPLLPLPFPALRGKGLIRKIMLPFHLARAFLRLRQEFKRIAPHVVLGLGGYISFPGGVMARHLGIPLVIHEQNAVPGLANRVLSFLAKRVLTGFPKALPRSRWVGNPVRGDISRVAPPEERMRDREGPLRLLVIGGSLGARVLNEIVPQGLMLIAPERRPEVVHQAGTRHLARLEENYAAFKAEGGTVHCVDFIEDMAGAYAWADIAICRAGALTIAELSTVGLASVLVPYPHAVDDHQRHNALFLTRAGGAFLLAQDEMTPKSVALIDNYHRPQLMEMAKQARALARPEAAREVAETCKEVAL
ncbi:MAG: undecaprenyldiphospho-muramoylpentapeptide beta-N-acetylglucosaminyltransferase [Zoogloeaceae bacterium]|jgi:UDP-N-acetylglucosamine--N-acetylmuramyl-(pentapeptide) pyrophosphoryl-undecaprenol N-acetylglucosamine transferase|nr:undecaprenyldiphospho-muramoylpentapeptide beta-N-acetylglucosaminyltransferase [Zoogloeaceae bacterium]